MASGLVPTTTRIFFTFYIQYKSQCNRQENSLIVHLPAQLAETSPWMPQSSPEPAQQVRIEELRGHSLADQNIRIACIRTLSTWGKNIVTVWGFRGQRLLQAGPAGLGVSYCCRWLPIP